jgi:hypothetical protein
MDVNKCTPGYRMPPTVLVALQPFNGGNTPITFDACIKVKDNSANKRETTYALQVWSMYRARLILQCVCLQKFVRFLRLWCVIYVHMSRKGEQMFLVLQ